MSFEWANTPSSFQNFINDILYGILDLFSIAYIDNIWINSNSKEKHWEQMGIVLKVLKNTELQADINKFELYVTEVAYLGLIITIDGIYIDSKKIEAVPERETLICIKKVWAFISFANLWFIVVFYKLVASMIAVIGKKKTFT